jgi:hypothetical protein
MTAERITPADGRDGSPSRPSPDSPTQPTMPVGATVEMPTDYDDMLQGIKAIAQDLRGIQELGVAQYTPVVEQIIATRSRDACHIQRTLDHILGFACHPAGLALYKKLCRYYYTLDPVATADYVNYYRKMWDSENPEEQK